MTTASIHMTLMIWSCLIVTQLKQLSACLWMQALSASSRSLMRYRQFFLITCNKWQFYNKTNIFTSYIWHPFLVIKDQITPHITSHMCLYLGLASGKCQRIVSKDACHLDYSSQWSFQCFSLSPSFLTPGVFSYLIACIKCWFFFSLCGWHMPIFFLF